MSKKKAKKRYAKKSTSKQVRKKVTGKVRSRNKGKTVKRNKARKAVKKSNPKTRLVSKRKQKPSRKRTVSTKRSTKKAGNKGRNVRSVRKAKKSKATTTRKRKPRKKAVIPKLFIHRNFQKDENGTIIPEYNSILTIEFPDGLSFKNKLDLIQSHPLSELDLMIWKHKPLPRAYMIILRTENPDNPNDEPYERANKLSAPEIMPQIHIIKESILESMIAFQDNYFEYIEGTEGEGLDSDWVYEPKNITGVLIRFFYPQ